VFNAKPLPVSLPTLFRRPVQSNHYEQQPLRATLAKSSAPRCGEDAADGQLRLKLLLLAFIECVAGAITRSPSAQSPGSTFFSSLEKWRLFRRIVLEPGHERLL
jgi:hypothetical protein